MTDCIFCQIAGKQAPASIVYEDGHCLAFLDLFPITAGHTLVIPKQHFVTLDDCDEETAGRLIAVVKKLNGVVARSVKCEGVLNEVMNGEAAGQEIFHLHFHIIPRYSGDGFGWFYPEGYHQRPEPRERLDEVAARIRKGMEGRQPDLTAAGPASLSPRERAGVRGSSGLRKE